MHDCTLVKFSNWFMKKDPLPSHQDSLNICMAGAWSSHPLCTSVKSAISSQARVPLALNSASASKGHQRAVEQSDQHRLGEKAVFLISHSWTSVWFLFLSLPTSFKAGIYVSYLNWVAVLQKMSLGLCTAQVAVGAMPTPAWVLEGHLPPLPSPGILLLALDRLPEQCQRVLFSLSEHKSLGSDPSSGCGEETAYILSALEGWKFTMMPWHLSMWTEAQFLPLAHEQYLWEHFIRLK